MNFQKTHIKSIKFTLQNVINIMVWFGSCDAFTPRLSWVLTAALFREWSGSWSRGAAAAFLPNPDPEKDIYNSTSTQLNLIFGSTFCADLAS